MAPPVAPPPAPFPVRRVLPLTLVLFANAVSMSVLFPFVGFMVKHLGEAATNEAVGYKSGFIMSAIMFGRLPSSILWGHASECVP